MTSMTTKEGETQIDVRVVQRYGMTPEEMAIVAGKACYDGVK